MKETNGALIAPPTESSLLSQGDIATLEKAGIIPAKTPFDQVMVFAKICRERGLSPFSKEIYLVSYGGKYNVIVGINGFRRLAADTGEHAGTDDARFDLNGKGEYKTAAELATAKQLPSTCTVTVYRLMKGQRVPFTHTAVFQEFTSNQNKWLSMPFQMIAKVAEAFALRKGFPDRLSGLSIHEEQASIEDSQPVTLPNQPGQTMEEVYEEIKSQMAQCKNRAELQQFYNCNPQWKNDEAITQLFIDHSSEKGWNKQ